MYWMLPRSTPAHPLCASTLPANITPRASRLEKTVQRTWGRRWHIQISAEKKFENWEKSLRSVNQESSIHCGCIFSASTLHFTVLTRGTRMLITPQRSVEPHLRIPLRSSPHFTQPNLYYKRLNRVETMESVQGVQLPAFKRGTFVNQDTVKTQVIAP